MANVSSATKHFASAKEGFVTTLASTVGSGAATVPLNSVTGYNNGDVAVFVIEPGNASAKQAVTGTIDTAGVQLTGCVWTEGTNQSHNAGSTVVDYVAATHMSLIAKGLLVEHKQTGAHSDITADSIVVAGDVEAESFTITGAGGDQGWLSGLPAPDTVTYNGNGLYNLVFNGTDLTDTVAVGMRTRTTRTVTAPIQCADLEASSTQYFNDTTVAGTTFTDDFCAGAWVKVESVGSQMDIVGRYNGTSGWRLVIGSTGLISLTGFNAASANFSQVVAAPPVQLNKWFHIAAQLDMSAFTATTTTSYVMIDGLDVPATVARGGTNPTALVQAGNLEVGASNSGTNPFDGKLSNVWYSSAKITQANMRTLVAQSITSAQCTAHSIVSAWTLNNTLNDVNTTSANNLTAQGSAVATNADSPFSNGPNLASAYTDGTIDFGTITAAVFSTNTTLTIQVPDNNAIPTTGGVTAILYSPDNNPYGFPADVMGGLVSYPKTYHLPTAVATTSAVAVDLTAAHVVPVNVGPSGCAFMILTMNYSNTNINEGGSLFYSVSGATTIASTTIHSFRSGGANYTNVPVVDHVLITGLNPGLNYVKAQYSSGSGGTGTFSGRLLTVIPL